MSPSPIFSIPKAKTEFDIFKEIILFVVLHAIFISIIFAAATNMSEALTLELYPLSLGCVGIYVVSRIIRKNRIVPHLQVSHLLQECSGFPALQQHIELTLQQNGMIRKSDLAILKAAAVEHLQCIKTAHQIQLASQPHDDAGHANCPVKEKISAYKMAIAKLSTVL